MKYDDKAILETVEAEMERDAEIIKAFESWERLDNWIENEIDSLEIPPEFDNF